MVIDVLYALFGLFILVLGIFSLLKKEGNRILNIVLGLAFMALGLWVIIQNLL